MKLIIDISNEVYNDINSLAKFPTYISPILRDIIKNGTPYEERSQGEWVHHTDGYIAFYTCNRCNGFGYKDDNFCNNCGADMRKGRINDNK